VLISQMVKSEVGTGLLPWCLSRDGTINWPLEFALFFMSVGSSWDYCG